MDIIQLCLKTLARTVRRPSGPPPFWAIVTICTIMGFSILVLLIGIIMQWKSPVPMSMVVAKRVPVIKTNQYESGLVCLAMVLEFAFNEKVSLDQLSAECPGTDLACISKTATDKGLSPKARKCTSRDLFKNAFSENEFRLPYKQYQNFISSGLYNNTYLRKMFRVPYIIHWNFNYFVVVIGFKYKKVVINHPEQGRISVSIEDFEKSFSGVVLTFFEGVHKRLKLWS